MELRCRYSVLAEGGIDLRELEKQKDCAAIILQTLRKCPKLDFVEYESEDEPESSESE